MKKNEKELESFWDGLLDVLRNPWRKPTNSSKTIPTPSNNDDLFGIYFNRLFVPYCIIVWYLCKMKAHFLRYALDNDDVIPTDLFSQSSRMTSHELYFAFSVLEPDNATLLLDRIECPVSVYTELKEALTTGEETRFVSAIDGLDLSEIDPFLKLVRFVMDRLPNLVEKLCDSDQNTDLDVEAKKKKSLYDIKEIATSHLGTNSKERRLINFGVKKAENLGDNLDSFLRIWYSTLFYQYCWMKKDEALNESDIQAFEYVFHQPAFEERYDENMKWWEDGVLDDKLEEYGKEWGVSEIAEDEPKKKGKSNDDRWRLQGYIRRLPEPGNDHCKGFKESICQTKSDVDIFLTKLIQGLADRKYIDNDPITKNSVAYILTGRGGFQTKIKKVEWHHPKEENGRVPESVKVLLFLSSRLFDARKTEGETYTQMFKHLNAGRNPYIKEDGRDQSPSYIDSVSDEFKEFYKRCLKKQVKRTSL